jgi:hypothetical protein
MIRRAPTYRDAYDHLSDIVHPNALGALIYFGQLNETGTIMSFEDAGTTSSAERARVSLILAVLTLVHVELAFLRTEEWLPNLDA